MSTTDLIIVLGLVGLGWFLLNKTTSGSGGGVGSPKGNIDSFGMKNIYKATSGEQVKMKKGLSHKNGQRYTANHKFQNYVMQGYFKIGKGQEQIEMKTDGPNHSGCTKLPLCMWYEPSILSDGKNVLKGEWPHPTSRNNIDQSICSVRGSVGKLTPGKWIGYAVAAYDSGGARVIEQWVDTKPFDGSGKPTNNWKMFLKCTDRGKVFPKQHYPRKLPLEGLKGKGLSAEIRMHKATGGDTDMKNVYIYEIGGSSSKSNFAVMHYTQQPRISYLVSPAKQGGYIN